MIPLQIAPVLRLSEGTLEPQPWNASKLEAYMKKFEDRGMQMTLDAGM